MGEINFFFEDKPQQDYNEKNLINWLRHVAVTEGKELLEINYIFCSDEYLYDINVKYLSHDYYTDIITFDNSEETAQLEGDIFVSLDRVANNANDLGETFHVELRRVLVHGLLHLIGYDDKTPELKKVMREKENAYLSLPEFQQ